MRPQADHRPVSDMHRLIAVAGVKPGRAVAVAGDLARELGCRPPRSLDRVRRGALCDALCRWLERDVIGAGAAPAEREEFPDVGSLLADLAVDAVPALALNPDIGAS